MDSNDEEVGGEGGEQRKEEDDNVDTNNEEEIHPAIKVGPPIGKARSIIKIEDPAPVTGPSKLPPPRQSPRKKKGEVGSQVCFQLKFSPENDNVHLNF